MTLTESYNTLSDEQLMMLYQRSKERELFEIIYERYFQVLCKYIVWISGDSSSAEDIAQNILVKLYNHPELFDIQKNLKVWLFVSVKNQIKNEKRNIARRAIHHEQIKSEVPISTLESVNENQQHQIQSIRKAINQLSDAHAEAIILKYSSNLTIAEISEALEVSIGTVKSRIFYGLKQIREKFNQKIESHE